jgi:hypothetical protein
LNPKTVPILKFKKNQNLFYDSQVMNDTSISNIRQKMINVHHSIDGADNESTS